ncbi:ABC transporter permease subunit [Aureimonas ureilytica]|uniref:ABC transporter permease subunit n=1 Tax=Aureimonas ureilytica TaxID=401562 RepID=UPI003CE8E11F
MSALSSRRGAALAQRLLPFVVPLLALLLWQAASSFGWIPRNVLPSPLAVGEAAVTLSGDGQLWTNLLVSLGRALGGFAIGASVGFLLGLANGLSRVSESVLDTTLQMVRNVPHLALIPLVIVWFGIGEEAKLFLVALGVFFPVYVNTFHGIRSVDPQLREMARVYRFTRWEFFRRVVLPGALPSILVGVRYALGIMWLTLIVAETISASEGLGYMAMQAREFMQLDVVVLAILIYAGLGKLADILARAAERRTLAWHPAHAA